MTSEGSRIFLAVPSGMDQHSLDRRPQSPDTEQTMAVSYGVIGALLFGIVGYALDRWLHTGPWLFVICLLVGVSIALFGVRSLIRNG